MNNDFVADSTFDCKVVLIDIYFKGLTVKSNLLLKVNQYKTHSVLSQRSTGKFLLETLKRKDHIMWPPSSVIEWTKLDHSVMNELLPLSSNLSIPDRVNCLESSIYDKSSDLFGFVLLPKKRFGGKNRHANISINLVIEKNLLLRELESVGDPLIDVEP